jgi:uncharacterized membrane protein
MSWQRFRIVRQIHARPRLMTATAVELVVAFLIPTTVAGHGVSRWLLAWNAGTLLYVLLAAVMMIRSSSHQMRRRAQLQLPPARPLMSHSCQNHCAGSVHFTAFWRICSTQRCWRC